jgi:hypothetical protein
VNDNIISINVPNAISIVLMALVGGALLALVKKAVTGQAPQIQSNVPGQ